MSSIETSVQNLSRDYPEWKPWLTVVEAVLKEATDPEWERFVPEPAREQEKSPLLARAEISIEVDWGRGWVKRLMRSAYKCGTSKMATLKPVVSSSLDIPVLFQASLCLHGDRLQTIAIDLGVDPYAFRAVAELIAVPFLQACDRRWTSTASERWAEGYCPVCGAWPAFAELRGIERSRYLRCARCGGEWRSHVLHCPYCGMNDHSQLVSLVPEEGSRTRAIEACRRCLGYVKSLTTLQATPPALIMVEDLASVDLDVAAADGGYRRLEGSGYSLDVNVSDRKGPRQRFFPWRNGSVP